MTASSDRIHYLFRQYLQKTCTREELQELLTCMAQPEYQEVLEQLMDKEYDALQPLTTAQEVDWEYIYQQVTQSAKNTVYPFYKSRYRWMRMAGAATIILALGIGGYWLINRSPKKDIV